MRGIVQDRVARSTGTRVIVARAEAYGMDPDDGEWVTVCVDHGGIVHHPTRALAVSWAAEPEGWCPVCMGEEPEENQGKLPPGFEGFEGFEVVEPRPRIPAVDAFTALQRGDEFRLVGPGRNQNWRVTRDWGTYKWIEKARQVGVARKGYQAHLESEDGLVRIYASTGGGDPIRSKVLDEGVVAEQIGERVESNPSADFETGRAVRFRYMHNTEQSPYMGARFGQDVEPHGTYLLEDDSEAYRHPIPGWEYGWAEFQCPLVLSFTTDPDAPHYGPAGWKARLVKQYGKKGKALTRALRKAGYDGIVTYWDQPGFGPSHTKEIVDLTFGAALSPE